MHEPPLRDEVLAAICGGDRELERDLLARFMHCTDGDAAELDAAIRQRVRERVEAISHLVQGRCKTIGAMTLAYAGERLECLASRGDWRDIEEAHGSVCHELAALRRHIGRRIA